MFRKPTWNESSSTYTMFPAWKVYSMSRRTCEERLGAVTVLPCGHWSCLSHVFISTCGHFQAPALSRPSTPHLPSEVVLLGVVPSEAPLQGATSKNPCLPPAKPPLPSPIPAPPEPQPNGLSPAAIGSWLYVPGHCPRWPCLLHAVPGLSAP